MDLQNGKEIHTISRFISFYTIQIIKRKGRKGTKIKMEILHMMQLFLSYMNNLFLNTSKNEHNQRCVCMGTNLQKCLKRIQNDPLGCFSFSSSIIFFHDYNLHLL